MSVGGCREHIPLDRSAGVALREVGLTQCVAAASLGVEHVAHHDAVHEVVGSLGAGEHGELERRRGRRRGDAGFQGVLNRT